MDEAICVMNAGGSFKSLTVLFANTTTSESGSIYITFTKHVIILLKKYKTILKLKSLRTIATNYIHMHIHITNMTYLTLQV